MVLAPINHVAVDERGTAFISGTSIRVTNIVIDTYTWHLSPTQILDNYPCLSLAEVHSALAYYHDHKAEIDRDLEGADQEYRQDRLSAPNPLSRNGFERRLDQTDSEPK